MTLLMILAAVVGGWMVQMYLTYQQSMAFNRQLTALRRHGTVSVGVAGRRYRGGRAYVALALDTHGIVRDAITLSGLTTFARGRRLEGLVDVKPSRIRSDQPLPGVSPQQHEAARQALELAKTRVTA